MGAAFKIQPNYQDQINQTDYQVYKLDSLMTEKIDSLIIPAGILSETRIQALYDAFAFLLKEEIVQQDSINAFINERNKQRNAQSQTQNDNSGSGE